MVVNGHRSVRRYASSDQTVKSARLPRAMSITSVTAEFAKTGREIWLRFVICAIISYIPEQS